MDLRVHSRRESIGRGERTLLRLPDRRTLDAFLKERIEPELRAQINAGQAILRLSIGDEFAGIGLVIDPRKSPYNSGSHAAYDVPTVRNRNPLYNVLKAKVRQLRVAEGITGIVVGDADSTALRDRQRNWNEVDAHGIVSDFLRQYSSIGFVLILSAREKQRSFLDINTPERILHGMLEIGAKCSAGSALDALFRSAMGVMPNPWRCR